jgi:hypothetical protein
MQLTTTVVLGSLLAACGGEPARGLPDAPPGPGIDGAIAIDAGCPTTFAVDQAHGDDGHAGNCTAPWNTLTHALATATTGQSIALAPGMYDAAAGESPSFIVPAGVALIGDEPGKGASTTIAGFHFPHEAGYSTAIELMSDATLAGVTIVNADPATVDIRTDLWVYDQNGITVRNSNLSNLDYGIWMEAGSHDATIDGNLLMNHKWNGILFVQAGANTRVEHNVITGNTYGVEYDSNGGDLGGGSTGSVGDNTIACNTKNDIWTNTASIAITAANDHWDHLPPTITTNFSTGFDIENGQSVPLDTTGATLAATPCP